MSATALSLPRRAFTIIELLVAVGVTAILVTLMVTITINVLNVWNTSSGSLSSGNQARLVLDQISQDLQGVVIRRDNNAWLVATVQRDQTSPTGDSGFPSGQWTSGTPKPTAAGGSLRINPTAAQAVENVNLPFSIENYRFGQAGVWLRFFTSPPDTNTTVENSSSPRAIAYQLVRRRIGANTNPDRVYSLFRSEVRPASSGSVNSTFGAGYDLLMDAGLNPSYNNGIGTSSFPGNVRQPNASFVIANDVIDFGVKLYGRNAANTEIELFPVQRDALGVPIGPVPTILPFSFAVSARTTAIPASLNSTVGISPNYGYPTAADVMVRILTPEGVRLIQAIEQGTSSANWWDTALQHSRVYTRRIEIKSTPL